MTVAITSAVHLANVYELLVETYGEPQNKPDYNPLEGLIGTILSQHTSDINSGRAYQNLITTFPTWEAVRDSATYEVAEAIKSGGLANVKAPRIQDALHTLTEWQQEQGGSKTLSEYLYDELIKRTPEEGNHYLSSIPGVGPKTAACVLMFNLGLAVMPVDTHVHRLSLRLGLIGQKVKAGKAHEILTKMTPAEKIYALHVNLIRHGRKVCHAQRPNCALCTLYQECAYVGSVNPQKMALVD